MGYFEEKALFFEKNKENVWWFNKNPLPLQPHLEKCLSQQQNRQWIWKLGGKVKAEIAQLVEHNLAKVGVAGPSPVFRSTF